MRHSAWQVRQDVFDWCHLQTGRSRGIRVRGRSSVSGCHCGGRPAATAGAAHGIPRGAAGLLTCISGAAVPAVAARQQIGGQRGASLLTPTIHPQAVAPLLRPQGILAIATDYSWDPHITEPGERLTQPGGGKQVGQCASLL
jgi:hypothetical protein